MGRRRGAPRASAVRRRPARNPPTERRSDDDRLQRAALPGGVGKRVEPVLVEVLARLVGVGMDVVDGDVPEPPVPLVGWVCHVAHLTATDRVVDCESTPRRRAAISSGRLEPDREHASCRRPQAAMRGSDPSRPGPRPRADRDLDEPRRGPPGPRDFACGRLACGRRRLSSPGGFPRQGGWGFWVLGSTRSTPAREGWRGFWRLAATHGLEGHWVERVPQDRQGPYAPVVGRQARISKRSAQAAWLSLRFFIRRGARPRA